MDIEVLKSGYFDKWFSKLRDTRAKITIARRIERIKENNFGDTKQIDANIAELRFTIGPGYRVYYTIHDDVVVLLLTGGDKSTQSKDISKAKEIYKELQDEDR